MSNTDSIKHKLVGNIFFFIVSAIMIGVGIFLMAYLAPKYKNDDDPKTSPNSQYFFGVLFIIVGLLIGAVGVYNSVSK